MAVNMSAAAATPMHFSASSIISSLQLCGFAGCAPAAAAVFAVVVVVVAASSVFSAVACIISAAELPCSVSNATAQLTKTLGEIALQCCAPALAIKSALWLTASSTRSICFDFDQKLRG
jgi:hypothetical protein